MSVTGTETVNANTHIFQIRGFILGPEIVYVGARRSSATVTIFVGNAHDLRFPLHRTHKHSNTKTTVGITAELQFSLINITSIAQIRLLTGSVIRDSQSRLHCA
jgi:hypothetical protein